MFGQKRWQPATSPFANLGAGSSGGTSSLFGTIGQGEGTTTNAFTFKPVTEFGAFGGDEGGGAFSAGVPTTGTRIFGASTIPTMSATASGSLPFWQSGPTTAFSFVPRTSADGTATGRGTSIQAFIPFVEKDLSNPRVYLFYHSITAMPAYQHDSLEELRVQDYQGSSKISMSRPTGSAQHATSDPNKQERLEALLRQLLLDETVDVRFHLFSMRSPSLGRVIKPRVLRTSRTFLAKSSKYFSNLLITDAKPSDSSWSIITDDEDVPSNVPIGDYGYESDSDLDDCEDLLTDPDSQRDQSVGSSYSLSNASTEAQLGTDDGSSVNGAGSVGSSTVFMTPELPRADISPSVKTFGARSSSHDETVVQKSVDGNGLTDRTTMRLRSLDSHVLVKDTAFRTWFTLLNYLYTEKVNFLPLSSATLSKRRVSLTKTLAEPRCSAKSMYRLATKVGLDYLRDEALNHIRSQLTERNIIKELSSSLVPRHPELFEMELDVLHSFAASPSVVADFPDLAQRIANKELAHGADIMVGMHMRLLRQLHPMLNLTPPTPLRCFPRSPEPVGNTPAVENENENKSERSATSSQGRRGKGKKRAS